MNNQDRIEKRPTWAMSPLNESQKEKLMRKSKEQPFVPAGFSVVIDAANKDHKLSGIAGLLVACAYGAWAYRYRAPHMTTSRYLMRLRVLAQSCVVGAIMVGAVAATSSQDSKTENTPR